MKIKIPITNKFFRLGIIVTFLAFLVYMAIAWGAGLFPFVTTKTGQEPGEYIINLERSEAEKQVTSDLEKNPENKEQRRQNDAPQPPSVNSGTGKQDVNVLLTNAGIFNQMVSASGMVTNSTESEGTCVYVFTNGVTEIVKAAKTLPNPTSTPCTTVSFPASELEAGGWSVYIKYDSSSSAGVSNEVEFIKE